MGSCWGSKEEAQEQAVVDPHKTLTVNYDKQAAAAGNPAGQPAKRRAHKHNAGAASTSTEPESSGPLAMKVIMLGPKTARQLIVQRQWAGKANSDEPVFDGEVCSWYLEARRRLFCSRSDFLLFSVSGREKSKDVTLKQPSGYVYDADTASTPLLE